MHQLTYDAQLKVEALNARLKYLISGLQSLRVKGLAEELEKIELVERSGLVKKEPYSGGTKMGCLVDETNTRMVDVNKAEV